MRKKALPEERKYHINRLGLHDFDDLIVYFAGSQLICWPPCDRAKFDTDPDQPRRLVIDANLTPQEAFDGMKEVIGLSPDAGRVLFSHAISGITRAAYIAAHVTPSATIELIDKHGTFKTTYSSFLTQLYNRDGEIEPISRMNSSPRFIEEILHEYSECTVVIDDIHPAETRSTMKSNEATAEEIIRRIGDNAGRGRMEGNTAVQNNPRGNAVFTGEYTIFNGSTAARSLVISFTTPINRRRLHKCQQQPLLVSTFYYNFIKWYVERYKEIVESLTERLAKHRECSICISPRLWETQFCLQSAYMLFLQYCLDNGFISTETARDEYRDFGALLSSLVRAQNARIEPDEKKPVKEIDYFKLLRELYKGDRFNLAKNKETFKLEKHDGFEYGDLLCLRSENLLKKVKKIVPIAELTDVRTALIAQNALKLDSEGKGVKINQQRYYGIYLEKLK